MLLLLPSVSQDARILGEMKLMQQIYANLFDLNRDLILEHTKRTTNHNQLLAALKHVRLSRTRNCILVLTVYSHRRCDVIAGKPNDSESRAAAYGWSQDEARL